MNLPSLKLPFRGAALCTQRHHMPRKIPGGSIAKPVASVLRLSVESLLTDLPYWRPLVDALEAGA